MDRIKGMIITGGKIVYPREVEEVLYTGQEVEGCAVIGLPDKEWGERVTALIAAKPGQKIVPEELKTFLKSRLSPFKVPKEYIVVSKLPRAGREDRETGLKEEIHRREQVVFCKSQWVRVEYIITKKEDGV